ncbi:MAG: universal stress protein [Verrucomicrobia bacterium]|nr:universal stress protein [Verrucomicrobiota bacterium]
MNGKDIQQAQGQSPEDRGSSKPASPNPKYVLRIRRIMVPIDFSEYSVSALRYARAFAQHFGASLILLHVNEPTVFPSELGYAPIAAETLDQQLRDDAHNRLKALAAECALEGLKADAEIRVGRPFNEIVTAAQELDADMIIIATHGFTGLTHVLMGSTAERVVRHARCPVLVVRENEREFVAPAAESGEKQRQD